jgi:hypothetical protein
MAKKKFRDTKFGQFLSKAKNIVPDALEIVLDSGGNPIKAVDGVLDKLKEKAKTNEEAQKLLMEYEQQKAEFERDYELSLIELETDDRANARAMQEKALSQNDKLAKLFIYFLAGFILVSATAFGVMLFFVDVPAENKRLVEMFADVYLFAGAIMVLQFFFGGSYKSKSKNQAEEKE